MYSLDDLKELGVHKGWCPYFLTRQLLHHANILVYNYQYMLDPKVANLVSRELEAESIVVFDEAHNIDNVCIEALSVTLDRRSLEASSRSVGRLQRKVAELKATDSAKLAKEYADLVQGLRQQQQQQQQRGNSAATGSGASSSSNRNSNSSRGGDVDSGMIAAAPSTVTDVLLANPLLSCDILEEAVPGNIRKAEHFVAFLKKIVQYLKTQLVGRDVENKTPIAFLHQMQEVTSLERKALRFTYTRLNSLLRTLEITSLDDFNALQDVGNFATLLATYTEGFAVISEPQGSVVAGVTEPLLQLCCLDASIAIRPVLERFQSVVITSGTLSPIDLYPKLLAFQPVLRASLPMSTFRPCLLPLVVTRGSDQVPISTRFELRKDIAVIRNYGQLLVEVAATVPDGVCCFFTSYQFMEYVVGEWEKMRILQKVLEHKLIYLETKDVVETTLALDNFKRACDSGRGAVFLSVARGKVAEGIDFDRHYGRAVLIFGIPYQYTLSHVLRARLNFMREHYGIRDNDFLTFDALRQSAQCVGRVIRSKTDYGIVVLADARYSRADKRSRFPPWILQFMRESCLNLPTDAAVDQMRTFLKHMGQPVEQEALHSILLNEAQVCSMFQRHVLPASPQPHSSMAAGGGVAGGGAAGGGQGLAAGAAAVNNLGVGPEDLDEEELEAEAALYAELYRSSGNGPSALSSAAAAPPTTSGPDSSTAAAAAATGIVGTSIAGALMADSDDESPPPPPPQSQSPSSQPPSPPPSPTSAQSPSKGSSPVPDADPILAEAEGGRGQHEQVQHVFNISHSGVYTMADLAGTGMDGGIAVLESTQHGGGPAAGALVGHTAPLAAPSVTEHPTIPFGWANKSSGDGSKSRRKSLFLFGDLLD